MTTKWQASLQLLLQTSGTSLEIISTALIHQLMTLSFHPPLRRSLSNPTLMALLNPTKQMAHPAAPLPAHLAWTRPQVRFQLLVAIPKRKSRWTIKPPGFSAWTTTSSHLLSHSKYYPTTCRPQRSTASQSTMTEVWSGLRSPSTPSEMFLLSSKWIKSLLGPRVSS